MRKQTLGERVKLLREAYGLSQADFAREIGKSLLTVGNLERGVSKEVQPETINNIIKRFKTTREWLINGNGEMNPSGEASPQPITPDYTQEAWAMAKQQLEKKDKEIEVKDSILQNLAISFDRVTKMMQDSGMSFLQPVANTGT
jgi:transcriptional regulator with XRE-family HTH domain